MSPNFPVVRRFQSWFEGLSPLHGALVVGVLSWAISFFLYSPPFWLPLSGGGDTPSRIDDFAAMCRNPFERDLYEPILAYRITTPLIAWMLGLRGAEGMVLQYMASVLMLVIVYAAMIRKTDRMTAAWATLGVAVSFTLIWTNTLPGFPDSVTHLAATVLLLSKNPFWVVVMTVAGVMNDERFVLAIPFILIWHAEGGSLKSLFASTWRLAVAFAIGGILAFGIRHAMTVGWIGPGIEKPKIYTEISQTASSVADYPWSSWSSFLINIVMTYRTLWVVFIAAFFCRVSWMNKGLVAMGMLMVMAASGTVADVSRSIGFAFPAFLLAVLALNHRENGVGKLLPWMVMGCLMTPSFHVNDAEQGIDLQVQYPLPISLLRAGGVDVLSVLR